ncbi:MAG: hypothetical protein ACT4OK_01780 [Gemmobacter sp.]
MTRFLPGLPADLIESLLRRSPGSEIHTKGAESKTNKFDNPDSSANLVANAFGRFLQHPRDLPPLPGVPMGTPDDVTIEAEMRFPWSGGTHPWLDVAVTTATTLVGIESKRYEPFRPGKRASFSEAYEKRDWGPGLARTNTLRRRLIAGEMVFHHLDAAQLVKHIYGLRTQGMKRAKGAVLVYLYAEPPLWSSGKPVDPAAMTRHREEIPRFAAEVRGDDVVFIALRWSEVLAQWRAVRDLAPHVQSLEDRFGTL